MKVPGSLFLVSDGFIFQDYFVTDNVSVLFCVPLHALNLKSYLHFFPCGAGCAML